MVIFAASAVSPNANHQDKTSSLFTIDCIAKALTNAAQTLEDPHVEEPESQQPFFDCITQVWHKHIRLFARELKDYSNKAHLSADTAAIQYSETLLQNQHDKVPDYETSDVEDEYSHLQNPTKTPSPRKIFLKHFLNVQLSTGHLKCAMILRYVFVHVQSIPVHGEKKMTSVFIMIMNARWVS